MRKTLRPHQVQALDMLRTSLREGKTRPVLQAPTGFGKTLVAAQIIENARAKGHGVWFVVPAISLVDQTVRVLYGEGISDIGVMQASHEMTDHGKPVQVVSVQTLDRRDLSEMPKPKVVLVDEAHRQHDVIARLIAEWPDVVFIGLSATPWAKGMGLHWSNLIVSASLKSLIEEGYLSKFRAFAPAEPDLTGVRVTNTAHGKDYAEGELSAVMQRGTLTADIVSTWLKLGRGRPTLVFAVDRAHAKHLTERFAEAGVRVAYQDAQTPPHEREAIRMQFANGRLEVVVNILTLTIGVDWDVRCVVFARPTKSKILLVQCLGRGLRTAPGKQDLMILDHAGAIVTLGLPTEIGRDSLHMGAQSPADDDDRPPPIPRKCEACTALFKRSLRACPECGWEVPVPKPRSPEVRPGQLTELEPGERRKTSGPKPMSPAEKRVFHGELRAYAEHHGRNDKWVLANYRERTGEWPRGPADPVPWSMISLGTLGWIRSRQIAYAKSKSKAPRPAASASA